MKTITQAEVAELLHIEPRTLARHLYKLMTDEGFPPPYIGNLNNGRKGPRRRWLEAAVKDWAQNRGRQTAFAAANDRGAGFTGPRLFG